MNNTGAYGCGHSSMPPFLQRPFRAPSSLCLALEALFPCWGLSPAHRHRQCSPSLPRHLTSSLNTSPLHKFSHRHSGIIFPHSRGLLLLDISVILILLRGNSSVRTFLPCTRVCSLCLPLALHSLGYLFGNRGSVGAFGIFGASVCCLLLVVLFWKFE